MWFENAFRKLRWHRMHLFCAECKPKMCSYAFLFYFPASDKFEPDEVLCVNEANGMMLRIEDDKIINAAIS